MNSGTVSAGRCALSHPRFEEPPRASSASRRVGINDLPEPKAGQSTIPVWTRSLDTYHLSRQSNRCDLRKPPCGSPRKDTREGLGGEPGPDEDAAIDLLVRELGATEVDPQAELIREWNATVYEEARARRGADKRKRER
jgi:hypothetical protein